MKEVRVVVYSFSFSKSLLLILSYVELRLINKKHRAIFPIGIFHAAFFYYKPHHHLIELHGLSHLRGHTLGILRGTIEDKSIFLANGVNVEESDSIQSLLRKLKHGRIDLCILVQDSGTYTIKQLFPSDEENFVQKMIPELDRPLAIMIDIDNIEGKSIALRYQKNLVKTLHSRAYRDILDVFYGKKTPIDKDKQLEKFIKYYENTWNNP